MNNVIFTWITSIHEAGFTIKRYYYTPDGELMVNYQEFVRVQNGLEISYKLDDEFAARSNINDLDFELKLSEWKLNEDLKDLHRTFNMFVRPKNDTTNVAES